MTNYPKPAMTQEDIAAKIIAEFPYDFLAAKKDAAPVIATIIRQGFESLQRDLDREIQRGKELEAALQAICEYPLADKTVWPAMDMKNIAHTALNDLLAKGGG